SQACGRASRASQRQAGLSRNRSRCLPVFKAACLHRARDPAAPIILEVDSRSCLETELARRLRWPPLGPSTVREVWMRRRDFLKWASGLAAGGVLSAPAIWSPAKAQSRQETLLIVSESGPNNVDIHGVGTNVPGYEVSWNCYDRLISHEMKTVNGTP